MFLNWIEDHLASTRSLVAIDIHSGLGTFGYDTLLSQQPADSHEFGRLLRAFGEHVSDSNPEKSVAYLSPGSLLHALACQFPRAQVDCILQEFGTYSPLVVLHTLRLENYWHQFGSEQTRYSSKQRLKNTFCPPSESWRRAVLARGEEVFRQARDLLFTVDNCSG